VFARRGVAGASIEEICEEGGFTRGAFYSNYGTKDDLILEIIDQEFARAVEGATGMASRKAEGQACEDGGATDEGAHEEFDFPFSTTPAAIIAQRDIQLHALRHPQLQARLDAVWRSHQERLNEAVTQLLESYGARATVPIDVLIEACHACYDHAAEAAVAADPDAETITVDRTVLLAVLVAFVEVPDAH
jgi:AcrR family transcriptional regulator